MIKSIRILLTFYQAFLVASFLITVACAALLFGLGINALVYLFWFKVFTSAVFYWAVDTYKKKEYFYYQNLGFSKTKLWLFSLSVDGVLLIIAFVLALKLTDA